jgi:hypothetical protein
MADASYELDIGVSSNAADIAAEVDRLVGQLDGAKIAASQAAEAVKLAEASYRSSAAAAESASKSLERMNLKVEEQRINVQKLADTQGIDSPAYASAATKLAALTSRQNETATAAAKAQAALQAEAQMLDRLKGASANATAEQQRISSALEKSKTASAQANKAAQAASGSGKVNEIGEAFGKLGGPLGSVGQKVFGAAEGFKKMSASLGSAGPYAAIAVALFAVAAGVAAIGAAVVAGVASILKWSVGLTDAARSQQLLLDGLAKSTKGGKLLADVLETVGNEVPLTTEELTKLAKPLLDAGLQGGELKDALRASAEEVSRLKFGPDFKKELLSLPNQTARLQKNFSSLFSGLKIEALLEGLQTLVSLFDKNTAAGRAIKVVFESLFQPLIDGFVQWIPKMERAFIQFEILVLKALIQIKPFGSTILMVAEIFGVLALVVGGALALAIGAIVAGVTLMAVGFGALIALVAGVASGFVWLTLKAQELTTSFFSIGTDMMTGLVNGITGGAAGVLKAITGSIQGAIDGAKSLLGIASPSKVFAEIGGYTAEGMSQGVDDGASDVSRSLESMVAPPDPSTAPAAKALGGGSGAPVFNLTVNAPSGDAEEIQRSVVDGLKSMLVSGGFGHAPA